MADSLFLLASPDPEAAKAARARGEKVIAWSEEAAAALAAADLPFARSVEALGDDPEMPLYRATADWTRAFGTRAVSETGETLKDALRFHGTTLWWWAELYLHHNTEAARRVRFLETLARVIGHFGGGAVHSHGFFADEAALAKRYCARHERRFVGVDHENGSYDTGRSALTLGWLEAAKMVATAVKGRGAPEARLVRGGVLFVSHAAFWRARTDPGGREESYEHYLDAVLTESKRRGLPATTLGVGPQTAFRTRTALEKWKERFSLPDDERYAHINRFVTPHVAAAALKAFGRALRVRRLFGTSSSLRIAFSHRGVSFDDLSSEDFGRTLLHQVPWAARCLLEFEAAFRDIQPRLVCLYAETSGLGRAAIESARALKVKSLGLQHGILYPNYFSYERAAGDLASGSPIPDVTAVYGEDGVRLLETTFGYPKGRVIATGSPRYDTLATELRKVKREDRRRSLGVEAKDTLLVLASRYRGIRDTHKAAGPEVARLLGAMARMKEARLIVKPHPAEPAEAYDRDIASANLGDRVSVVTDRSLTDLLPAADLLITVESLSATEALVAGVPVLVLRHPSNLREVVASGAALGVPDGADPLPVIESLLRDEVVRTAWRNSRDAFLDDVAHGVDGQALNRLQGLIAGMADLDDPHSRDY